jgi:hypothetical protein
MPDERISRGLLPALWSFLQHPAAAVGDHWVALEERLRVLEARLVGDLKTAVDTRVVGVEEIIRGRVAEIQARLESVKKRAVEDLKHELRRVVLILALVLGCGVLALIGATFGLMAAWTALADFMGAVDASLVLTTGFLIASLVVFGLLRSVLHRP